MLIHETWLYLYPFFHMNKPSPIYFFSKTIILFSQFLTPALIYHGFTSDISSELSHLCSPQGHFKGCQVLVKADYFKPFGIGCGLSDNHSYLFRELEPFCYCS